MESRLLGLSTSFPLRDTSSSGIFVKRLYEHLPDGWRVEVVCPDDDAGSTRASAPGSRIRLHPVRYAPRALRVLAQKSGGVAYGLRSAPWRASLIPFLVLGLLWRSIMEGRHANLLHANWAVCGAIAVFAGKILSLPVVSTLRGDDVTRAASSPIDRMLLHLTVKGSASVVCVSDAMAAELRDRYPERRHDIHVCLNGVDPTLLSIRRSPRRPGILRIAAIGSLIRRKGFDVLIRAVAAARSRGSLQVRVAGAGPELDALRSLAIELGVLGQFEFCGELAPAEIPEFLAHADVFVLASRSEGRPNAVIEALAAGLPTLCTDLPGISGLVEHRVNGWRVPIDSPAALAAAIDEASESPDLLLHMGAAAKSRIESEGHTWLATGRCYELIFRSALAGMRRGAP